MYSRMRAADADRERVVVMLHEQVGTGRLTLDEFSQRSATAYQSDTIGELDELTRDLPRPAPMPIPATQPSLLPVFLVLTLALLLGGTFFALTSLGTADSMNQMMSHMTMGR
jgi:Domain of unknown function (DUF1707)